MFFRLRMPSLRNFLLALALLVPGVGSVSGQESVRPEIAGDSEAATKAKNPSETRGTSTPARTSPPLKPASGDWLYLMDSEGKLRPVPVDADLMEFLNRSQKTPQDSEGPDYSFSDVTVEGSASEEEATLTVTLSLQIAREGKWIRVPLGLNEAVLRQYQHDYEPTEKSSPKSQKSQSGVRASFAGFDKRGGYEWWFRGEGQHVLTLDVIVPLRKSSGVRRLQLAVPDSASSYLRIALPVAKDRLSLETVAGVAHKAKSSGQDATEVKVFRLGDRLDLGWRAIPDSRQVQTLLKAETELRVEPTQETILLNARQFIEPLQGSMSEVEISLPKGFAVLELKLDGERYPALEDLPDAPKPVKIALPAPTTERIRLDWLLQAPWPESGELTVEGFLVSDSLRQWQSGEIAVVGLEGYRIVKRPSTRVYRTNVREHLGPGPIFSAYQFRQQPFELVLGLQEIEPSYSIRPHLVLKMGEKQMDLLLDLELEVYRGVLQTLELDWPNLEAQGWTIDQTGLPGEVEQIEMDPETDRTTIVLAKRIRQGEPFTLRLRANRVLAGPGDEEFPLTLPRVIAPNSVPTVVVVTHHENVESRVMPEKETETQPLSASLTEDVESLLNEAGLRDFRGPRQEEFLVSSDPHTFRVKLITHPQSIRSESRVRVTVSEEHVEIRHTLNYNVQYEPVSQLPVTIPPSFPEGVQFSLGEVAIPHQWTDDEGNGRQAVLTLPEPKLNEFELVAEYLIPAEEAETRKLQVPVVRANDADEITGRLEFVSDYRPEVTIESSGWSKTPDAELTKVWTCADPGDSLALTWTPRREADLQSFTIRRTRIRSVIQREGPIYSLAEYQFDQPLEELLISLPPEQIRPNAFHWNGTELTEDQVTETEPGSGLFRLELPSPASASSEEGGQTANSDSPVLVVVCRTAENARLEWSQRLELVSPSFPGDVWTEKTTWEVTLPVDHHLLTVPENYAPEFVWARDGMIWNRVPRESSGESNNWPELPGAPYAELFPSERNTYQFSYVGPNPPLRFSSMNRSMVVLFGAGLALLCGFVLLKIPATRNVLTLLFVVFLFAVSSIWFTAPMQLLLQPAVLGLVLAIVAVFLDGAFKRTASDSMVALTNPNEFSGSSTSQPLPAYPDPIGSEDPTAVRQSSARSSGSSVDPSRSAPQQTDDPSPSESEFIGSSISERSE